MLYLKELNIKFNLIFNSHLVNVHYVFLGCESSKEKVSFLMGTITKAWLLVHLKC